MPDFPECPSCGRKTLVTRNADVYQCILCDFKRDLSKLEKASSGNDMPWLLLVVFFVLVVFLSEQQLTPSSQPPYYEPMPAIHTP